MTYYNNDIPAADHNPSNDQPEMLRNTQGISTLIAVDHVPFNTTNSGQHAKVTYNNVFAPGTPPAPTDPVAIGYTANDTIGHPNLFLKNSQASFMLSCIKAFGVFNSTNNTSNVTPSNSYNVNTTITKPNAGTYVITLTANVVSGNNVVILVSPATNYSFSSGVLTILYGGDAGVPISFLVLQA